MIKKLRLRFICMAMLSVAIVLLLLIGTINLINYRHVTGEADAILDVLAENDGDFPLSFRKPGWTHGAGALPAGEEDSTIDPEAGNPPSGQAPGESPPGPGQGFGMGGKFTEETAFESRFFSFTLDEDGAVSDYDLSQIAAVSNEEELVTFAQAALKERGFFQQYRYRKVDVDGETKLIFLDCRRSLSNARNFLIASILVSLLGFSGVLLLVVLFSGRIVRPVQESYEKQKRFITDAGHELKTPLTIIDADISVAEMEYGANEWTEDVKIQTKRLADLTADLIYLSRMDEDRVSLQTIDFSISDLVSESVQAFRSRAQLRDLQLEADITPMLSCHGDEKALGKLVGILMDNAIKYCTEAGRIDVSLKQNGRATILTVENDVEELHAETLPHLFDRFYRADASRTESGSGYGIGLSIAQAIVTAHRGTIVAEAAGEKKIRFRVTI